MSDGTTDGLIRELEAEVKRWRAEANRRTHEIEMTYSVQKKLRAEIERLRAALKFYARTSNFDDGDIARAALKEGK